VGDNHRFDLLFLGSGNAFGLEGRAFSSFILNGRFLFDCGPTLLQQLKKAKLSVHDIDAVFISHFHADHFFGMPFFLLDSWYTKRERPLSIVGPQGVQQRLETMMELAYPDILAMLPFEIRYAEAADGMEGEVEGLSFTAAQVEHVPALACFAYKVFEGGRSLVFSGDSKLCAPLLDLASGADVLVLECSCAGDMVHLGTDDIREIVSRAPAHAQTVVTHLDDKPHPEGFRGLYVASDLSRFSL
jgi:ribonuclease BN (tRNA processing enzyme)